MPEENFNETNNSESLVPKERKSIFDVIPSKTSFFAGLISGVMAFSTLGFVLMLAGGLDFDKLGLKGGSVWGKKPAANVNSNLNTNAPTDVDPLANLPPVTSNEHIRGDLSKAKFVLIEYSDYECPFCKTFHSTMQNLIKSYGTDVAWIYRHFPLSFHANAQKESEAVECAAELGGNDAFWKMTDAIYSRTISNGTGFALDKLVPLAKELGLDQTKFKSCLDSGKYAQKVSDDMAGGSAAGIEGTPGTIILTKDGKSDIVSGAQPEASIKATIDALLK